MKSFFAKSMYDIFNSDGYVVHFDSTYHMYFNKTITWLNYFVSDNTATIDSDVIIHTYIGQPDKGNLKIDSSNGTIMLRYALAYFGKPFQSLIHILIRSCRIGSTNIA